MASNIAPSTASRAPEITRNRACRPDSSTPPSSLSSDEAFKHPMQRPGRRDTPTQGREYTRQPPRFTSQQRNPGKRQEVASDAKCGRAQRPDVFEVLLDPGVFVVGVHRDTDRVAGVDPGLVHRFGLRWAAPTGPVSGEDEFNLVGPADVEVVHDDG